eukprot:360465-Chlamydomonas_euryale.AAC.6
MADGATGGGQRQQGRAGRPESKCDCRTQPRWPRVCYFGTCKGTCAQVGCPHLCAAAQADAHGAHK